VVQKRRKKKGRIGLEIQALLDKADTDLSKLARKTRIPLRTLQDWELLDELPDTELARERWQKIVSACTPPGEERQDMLEGNHPMKIVRTTPPDDSYLDLIERVEELEDFAREILNKGASLRAALKRAATKRRRNTG
jgi:hypothetical protein